jgi:hypothetical protein
MTPKGTPQNPPRVDDPERYWGEPPPVLSPRCVWWISRFEQGWRPGRAVRSLGYYSAAFQYGVYLWEYLSIIGRIEHCADHRDEHDPQAVAHREWSRAHPGQCHLCQWDPPS